MRHQILSYPPIYLIFSYFLLLSYRLDLYDDIFFFDSASSCSSSNSFIILKNFPYNKSNIPLSISGYKLGGKYMGLGNQMFIYASLYGIGRRLGASKMIVCQNRPKLDFIEEFENVNNIDRYRRLADTEFRIASIRSAGKKCCHYVNVTGNLSRTDLSNIDLLIIDGFLQSWKYFSTWRREIVDQFKFKKSVVEKAKSDFRRFVGRDDKNATHYACIHVRRGDFQFKRSNNRGYFGANSKMVMSGIRFINRTLNKKQKPLKILVFSDDPAWCLGEFSNLVTVIGKQSASVGMQTMNEYCDTFLLISGASTFGWWSAYLNKKNADVYYNTKMLVPGSPVEREMDVDDYFPPDWTAVNLDN